MNCDLLNNTTRTPPQEGRALPWLILVYHVVHYKNRLWKGVDTMRDIRFVFEPWYYKEQNHWEIHIFLITGTGKLLVSRGIAPADSFPNPDKYVAELFSRMLYQAALEVAVE